MKLLKDDKSLVAFLDEGTTKIAYYGKDPAIIYFTKTGQNTEPNKCTVTKIESLAGYIETDAGVQVKIEGTLQEKIDILEKLLGCKLGYYYEPNNNFVPDKTVEFYKENDNADLDTITITVTVNEVGSENTSEKVYEFTRGPNVPTVKDIVKKIKDEFNVPVEVESVKSSEDALSPKDKLLEDQELTATFVYNWVNKFVKDVHAGTFNYGPSSDETPVDQSSNQNKITVEKSVVGGEKIVTLTGDLTQLDSWTSTNPEQQDAQHKWFALDIAFVAKKVSEGIVWGDDLELTPEFLALPENANEGKNTIVLWLAIDNLTETDRVISIKDKNNPEDIEEITIKFVNTAA